jgi:hypothetical protein
MISWELKQVMFPEHWTSTPNNTADNSWGQECFKLPAQAQVLCCTNTVCVWFVVVRKSIQVETDVNTLRTGDADLCLYITTVQDGWRKSAFLTSAWFPARSRVLDVITQYMAPVSEWSCWRMFTEMWPHSELMICDKYREQTALYLPLSLRSV